MTLWGLVGREGLDCCLLLTYKQLFQYFIYCLGSTDAISSDRPRQYWTKEKRQGDKTRDYLISQVEPQQWC